MPIQLLLQIGLLGVLFVLPKQGLAQLMCLSNEELVAGNYKLQEPTGPYSGEIPDGSVVLRIYLQPDKDREVFALSVPFELEQVGTIFSPVFICEQARPVWYQMPNYAVACPREKNGPVQVIAPAMDLFRSGPIKHTRGWSGETRMEWGQLGLTYWVDSCVAWRRISYECFQPKIYPDIPKEPRPKGEPQSCVGFRCSNTRPDPRNRDVPFQCNARHTIQFMTPIPHTK